MGSPARSTRPFFPLLLLSLLTACGDEPVVRQDAWEQIDLLAQRPRVGRSDGTAQVYGRFDSLRHRTFPILEQQPDQTLRWHLHLGSEPSLSFRPLPEGTGCIYRIVVADGAGSGTVVFRQTIAPLAEEVVDPGGAFRREKDAPERVVLTVPQTRTVDLSAFAGRRIHLILQASAAPGETCAQARWASPIVQHRRPQATARTDRPNVLLIGIDTLRADALGVYGRQPSVSPAIDDLAARSDLWLKAFSSTNNTNPSFISLMTGLYAKNHGIYDLKTPLPDHRTTLAEVLKEAGYHTYAALSATHLGGPSGLAQGFDTIEFPWGILYAETVVDRAVGYMQESPAPFFIWLHFFDPHVPHNPPSPYDQGYRPAQRSGRGPVLDWTPFRPPGPRPFDQRSPRHLPGHADLYPGELAYVDHQLDRLFAFMESRGLFESTVVVLVADHGETLGERGAYFDHAGLFDNTTHVPLMIHWPGQRQGRRIPELVQHLDLFPTLLNHLGLEVPEQDGEDLLAMAAAGRGRRAVFAEHANDTGALVRTSTHALYVDRVGAKAHFFDLKSDPAQQHNLAGSGLEVEAELQALLDRWLAARRAAEGPAPTSIELSEEEKRQLEALGYAQ